MTPVQKNLGANLSSQCLIMALGVVCLPLIVRLVGMEAYGLIGVLLTLQSVVAVLDFGWGVAANRELARLSAIVGGGAAMRPLIWRLGIAYFLASIGLALASWFLGPAIGVAWFQTKDLSDQDLATAIRLIGLAIAVQTPLAFFSACVAGLQRIALLSVIRAVAAVAGYPGAVVALRYWSPTIACFLLVQIAVLLFQLAAVIVLLVRSFPTFIVSDYELKLDWGRLSKIATEVFGISLCGVVLSHADKILLSRIITLEQFGFYSVAASVSAGILGIGAPVFSVVLPRLSHLKSGGNNKEMEVLYHQASQFVAVVQGPVGVVLACFPGEFLLAWTGNVNLAAQSAEILRWLAVGSVLVGLNNIPYAVQLAYAWTRLPLAVNLLAVLVALPLTWCFSIQYGGVGAAAVWVVLGAYYVLCGVPLMHRWLLRGSGMRWLLVDNAMPLLAALIISAMLRSILPTTTRPQAGFAVLTALAATYLGAFVVAPTTRRWAWELLQWLAQWSTRPRS